MKSRLRGVGLIEFLIVFAIVGILVAFGVPQLTTMIDRSSVKSAAEFYAEGLRLARSTAVRRNGVARFVLNSPNTNDWTVSWCQPTSATPCTPTAAWTEEASHNGSAFSNVDVTSCPAGVTEVDFSALGWVVTGGDAPIAAVRIDSKNPDISSTQLQVNISGSVSRCDPGITNAADSRHCATACP